MYFSWYDMIVDHKGGAGTAADIEYDYGAGGGMSCHVWVPNFVIFVYNEQEMHWFTSHSCQTLLVHFFWDKCVG